MNELRADMDYQSNLKESYNYVGEPNPNLLCCICRAPFLDPVTTRSCGHTFCRTCLVQALDHAKQCPVDRSPLSLEDLTPTNPIIRALVDELIVECIHTECPQTTQRQLLTSHLLDSCPFSLVSCPTSQCDETLHRKDLAKHDCTNVTKLVPCDLCGTEISLDDLELHVSECQEDTTSCTACSVSLTRAQASSHSETCPATIVDCVQAPNGCSWNGPRSLFESSHKSTCPYEAIAGFFALNSTRHTQLEQENNILRYKMATLEDTVHTLRRELQSAKAALGPWYRADGVSGYSSDRQSTSSGLSSSISTSDPTPPIQDYNALAAYFPSEDTPSNRAAGFSSPSSQSSWEASRTERIAPLNLSTSLEGALVGIRESVVTLDSALDSLGRRADIALANETMRLNEDVMSLRANIHGLRMQVHTIMIERNAQVTGRNPEMVDGAWPALPTGRYYSGTKL